MLDVPYQIVRVVGYIAVLGPPVAVFVYRDRKRGGKSYPLAWALGLGLLGIPGLLWYLYLRGDFSSSA